LLQVAGAHSNRTIGAPDPTQKIDNAIHIFTRYCSMYHGDLFYWFVYHFNDYSSLSQFNLALVNGPFSSAINYVHRAKCILLESMETE